MICSGRRGDTDWSGIRMSAETETKCFCPLLQVDMTYGLFRRGKILGEKGELSVSFLIDPHLACTEPTDFLNIDEKISSFALVKIEDYTVFYLSC